MTLDELKSGLEEWATTPRRVELSEFPGKYATINNHRSWKSMLELLWPMVAAGKRMVNCSHADESWSREDLDEALAELERKLKE